MTSLDRTPRRLVIDAPLPPALRAAIAAHPARPVVAARAADAPPWQVSPEADLLVCGPDGWDRAPARPPEGWPFGLRQINVLSAGVDRFPDWALRAVPVACGRGISAEPIAEFVLAAILGREKRLVEHARAGTLSRGDRLGGLRGRTVGLLGTGRIGQAVARLAGAFGMRVVGTSRRGPHPDGGGVEWVATPAEVAAAADHLVLALPLTPATRGIVDAGLLARLRPGAHLVNVARGALVDQQALLAALDAGRLGFATLDVTEPEPLPADHPLAGHPRVLVTPHVSWSSDAAHDALRDRIGRDIDRFLSGAPPIDAVDPEQRY